MDPLILIKLTRIYLHPKFRHILDAVLQLNEKELISAIHYYETPYQRRTNKNINVFLDLKPFIGNDEGNDIAFLFIKILKDYLDEQGIEFRNGFNYNQTQIDITGLKSFIQNYNHERFIKLRESFSSSLSLMEQPLQNVADLVKMLVGDEVTTNNLPIFNEFEEYCIGNHEVIFYPSSSIDICDFNILEFQINANQMPKRVFLHVDYYSNVIDLDMLNNFFNNWTFTGGVFQTGFSNDSRLQIIKAERYADNRVVWIVLLSQTQNKDIMAELIKNNIQIKTLVHKCDGGDDTHLYACFASVLGINQIISENNDFIERFSNSDFDFFIQKINKCFETEVCQPILQSIQNHNFDNLFPQNIVGIKLDNRWQEYANLQGVYLSDLYNYNI